MGYWVLRNNERSKEMKESIIWCEKYSELEIHRKCVRSSTWVSEVLRIWGGVGSGKRDGKYSQEGQTHKIDVVWV